MGLRRLDAMLRPVFVVPRDDIASGLLIPAMSNAVDVHCMAGFFSSSSLAQLAPGLAAFLNGSSGQFRLLVSPKIEERDRLAMEEANADPEAILAEAARKLFRDGAISETALARHTKQCLAYLLASGRLELRFVLMRRGMFHPKVWIFSDAEATLVAHGSSNPTEPGLLYNFETVSVERSWVETAKTGVFAAMFKEVWAGTDQTTLTIKMPEGLHLVKAGLGSRADCPTVSDFWRAWHEDAQNGLSPSPAGQRPCAGDGRTQPPAAGSAEVAMGRGSVRPSRKGGVRMGGEGASRNSGDCDRRG